MAELVDFMPLSAKPAKPERPWRLVRVVTAVRGALPFRLVCRPAFDYGRARHEATAKDGGVLLRAPGLTLSLTGTAPFRIDAGGAVARRCRASRWRSFRTLDRAASRNRC
jgi:hypothetical protein